MTQDIIAGALGLIIVGAIVYSIYDRVRAKIEEERFIRDLLNEQDPNDHV